jgi:hypothetical protein
MSPTERYQRITQIMDEAYRSYEDELVALRKRVVEDMKRKVKESGVLDHPREGSAPRSSPSTKRR